MMESRALWVDVAKGAAIALVVLGHAWRGLYHSDLIEVNLFSVVDAAIYSFHMPLFFMISGFFFFSSIRQGALRAQIIDITRRLLVPLVLWTYIFLSVRWAFSDFTNAQPDYTSLLVLPLPGILHFWFLWALWLIHICFVTMAHIFPAGLNDRVLEGAVLGSAVGFWVFASYLPFQGFLGQAYNYAIFFALGAVLYTILSPFRVSWRMVLTAALFCAGLLFLTQAPGLTRWTSLLLAFGLSIGFLVLIKGIAVHAASYARALQWVGVCSFPIYMMHTIFSAGIREVLLSQDVTALGLHLLLGVVLGVVCPIGVTLLLYQTRVGEVLGLRIRFLSRLRLH